MLKKIFAFILLLISILIIVYSGLNKPSYNFDRLFYMGVVLKMSKISPEESHVIVINEFKNKLNKEEFRNTFTSSNYNKIILESKESYQQQLPLYTTKPLYLYFYYVVYTITGKILESGIYLNIFFYLLTYLLFFKILCRYINFLLSAFLALFTFCNPLSLDVLSLGTPDVVASYFILLCVYFSIINFKNILYVIISLVLMIFTRNDNVVFSLFFFIFLYISNKISKVEILLTVFFTLISFFFSYKIFDDYYGFSTTYYHTFITLLSYPKSFHAEIGIKEMLGIIFNYGNTYVEWSFFVLSLIIMFFSMYYYRRSNGLDYFELSILFTFLVKYLMFPAIWNRFNFIFVVLLIINFFRNYQQRLVIDNEEK